MLASHAYNSLQGKRVCVYLISTSCRYSSLLIGWGQVPSGLLPAMELDGRLIVESAEIMRILEEAFPDNTPLLPPNGSKDRQRADSLMRLERRLFSDWLSWLTTSWQAPDTWLSCLALL